MLPRTVSQPAAPAINDLASPRPSRDLAVASGLPAVFAWLRLAARPSIVRRALLTAVIVGSALTLINHGDAILRGSLDYARFAKMLLTFAVPYVVSTVSSVAARRELEQG